MRESSIVLARKRCLAFVLSIVTQVLIMRTDMPPFTDVRVRRTISHAIDRQGLIEAVWGRRLREPCRYPVAGAIGARELPPFPL